MSALEPDLIRLVDLGPAAAPGLSEAEVQEMQARLTKKWGPLVETVDEKPTGRVFPNLAGEPGSAHYDVAPANE